MQYILKVISRGCTVPTLGTLVGNCNESSGPEMGNTNVQLQWVKEYDQNQPAMITFRFNCTIFQTIPLPSIQVQVSSLPLLRLPRKMQSPRLSACFFPALQTSSFLSTLPSTTYFRHLITHHKTSTAISPTAMSTKPFQPPPRAPRMLPFGSPSVWLEFTPLSKLTNAINLGQGAPGWGPPPFLTSALQAAVSDEAYSQYARSAGAPELVDEISRLYTPRLVPPQLQPSRIIDANSEVLVTVGASEALYVACTTLLGHGDEAVLVSPAFDIYSGAVQMSGATPKYVPLRMKQGRKEHSADLVLDMVEFGNSFSNNTKLLILNSPHNPTGKVFSREEYLQILAVLEEKAPRCVVLSDEVYEHLVFEGEHIPFASISPSAFERTLSVYSAGKTFSATGLKIGWVVGPSNLMRDLQIAHQFIVFAINAPSQIAIASALRQAELPFKGFKTYYDWICDVYEKKRDFLVDAVRKAGMSPIVPDGAFYICAQVPHTHPAREFEGLPKAIGSLVEDKKLEIDQATVGRSDYNICRNLVLRYGVTAIPNSAFFTEEQIGDSELTNNYIRLAFCKPDGVLQMAKQKICGEPKSLPLKVAIETP